MKRNFLAAAIGQILIDRQLKYVEREEMTPIEQAIEALEESRRTTTDVDVLNQVEAAIDALRAQPERKRSFIWGKSPVLINGLKFEVAGDGWFLKPEDGCQYEISTAQPDHSELARTLRHAWERHTGAEPSESYLAAVIDEAADALEGKL